MMREEISEEGVKAADKYLEKHEASRTSAKR